MVLRASKLLPLTRKDEINKQVLLLKRDRQMEPAAP